MREPADREFHLHIGKESIVHSTKRTPHNMGLQQSTGPLQYVSFFGRCYHCKCSGHSQKYCPLRICKQCKQYGHSELACWRKKIRVPSPSPPACPPRTAPTAPRDDAGK